MLKAITHELLETSLNFASSYVELDWKDLQAIRHSRKWMLFKDNEPWVKRNNANFDVSMGAYDGAEICELVGIYILHTLAKDFNKEYIGLYRDDGLVYFRNTTGRQADVARKKFHEIFRQLGLEVEIQCNLRVVNFLDVTLNLNDGSYRPYRKQDQETLYINTKSNHPRNIIKQLPITIEKRINELSSNESIFNEAAHYYQEVLRQNGYNYKLNYQNGVAEVGGRRQRSRAVIWFNPPYSKNVSTNVGKYFLMAIDKHFHSNSRFRKIFNRNTLKISYSCMPNVKSIINGHNRKMLKSKEKEKECNCKNKENCPLDNKCLSTSIVYEAKISDSENDGHQKTYFGICEGSFKLRYGNHKKSFSHEKYKSETELSKEYWSIKEKGGTPKISWQIKKVCKPYNPMIRRCDLCLSEKYFILQHRNVNLLNKRSELISRCRHRNKHLLAKT